MEMGKCKGIHHVVDADDVTDGSIGFNIDSQAATGAIATLRNAAGVLKAWDGVITVTSDTVTLDNSGSVDFAETDTFDVVVVSG